MRYRTAARARGEGQEGSGERKMMKEMKEVEERGIGTVPGEESMTHSSISIFGAYFG